MATILGSKTFETPDTGINDIVDWLAGLNLEEGAFRLTLEDLNGGRQKKSSAADDLAYLVNGSRNVWKKDGYLFDFFNRLYTWRGKQVHITAGEALYLYRGLVLRGTLASSFYTYNMRRRLGQDFLKEVLV